MHALTFALIAVLQVPDTTQAPRDTVVAAPLDSATVASAFLDSQARALAEGVRARQAKAERNITAYRALVQEQISFGMRALRRDRLLWRRETAARIDWQRNGPVGISVLGAREVLPVLVGKPQVPAALRRFVPHLAFEPGDETLLMMPRDTSGVRHPLAPRGERHYRFRSGGTTTMRLPDGRQITLRELEFLPRRKDFRLISGSFWIDDATHAIVQAVFRLSREFDLERDDPDDDVPGFMKPIRANMTYATIEYGLIEFRWWLPRLVAVEGWAQAGNMLRVPARYELAYSDYEVVGDTAAPPRLAEASPVSVRCRNVVAVQVRVGGAGAVVDTAAARKQAEERRAAEPDSVRERREREEAACARYTMEIPDSTTLLTSPLLGESPFALGEVLVTESELRELADQIKDIADAPWKVTAPRFSWGLGRQGLIRYNRIEGLAIGARLGVDLGPATAEASVHLPTAAFEPSAELAVTRPTLGSQYQLRAYRSLNVMDRTRRPFALGYSLAALVFGRDELDYYRATGLELTGTPSPAREQWYAWRMFAQIERAVEKETDFSVRQLFDDSHEFPANRPADRADQYGAGLALRYWHGHDPDGFRFGAELDTEAASGTFQYVRPAVTLRTTFPLPGRFVGALEGATGSSGGDLPVQHLWYLGGAATLRGYAPATQFGEAFWRGRTEIATALPLFRIVGFGDVGRAASRDAVYEGRPLLSAGAGLSALDGLFRFDVARALRPPTGWRVAFYVDATL